MCKLHPNEHEMIHLKTLMKMILTEVRMRRAGLGFLTQDGLDKRNLKLQLARLGPIGPGVKCRKVRCRVAACAAAKKKNMENVQTRSVLCKES